MTEQQSARIETVLRRGNASGAFAADSRWHVFRVVEEPAFSVYRIQAPLGESPIVVAYVEGEEVDFDDLDYLQTDAEGVTFGIERSTDRIRLHRPTSLLEALNNPRRPASSHLKPLDVEITVEDIH